MLFFTFNFKRNSFIKNLTVCTLQTVIFYLLTNVPFYAILKAEPKVDRMVEREADKTVGNKSMALKKREKGHEELLELTEKKNRYLWRYNEQMLRLEVVFATIFYVFILLWVLCLKFGNVQMLTQNYINLSELTLRERFLWDIVPFYTRQNHTLQWLEFFANSLVFAPFGVLLNYLFAKKNILRDFALCLGLSLSIEVFQLFTMLGGFATVDLIMNALGYFVGLGLYYLIFKKRSIKTCIWVCRVANFIFFALFFCALVTTVENRELIVDILTKQL